MTIQDQLRKILLDNYLEEVEKIPQCDSICFRRIILEFRYNNVSCFKTHNRHLDNTQHMLIEKQTHCAHLDVKIRTELLSYIDYIREKLKPELQSLPRDWAK